MENTVPANRDPGSSMPRKLKIDWCSQHEAATVYNKILRSFLQVCKLLANFLAAVFLKTNKTSIDFDN